MKVVYISTLTPSGHYSQYVTQGLKSQPKIDLYVYAAKDEKDKLRKEFRKGVKYVWRKGPKFAVDIVREIARDKPDIVHIQQEFNMYGSFVTAVMLPWLALGIRLMNYPVVMTIHAAVKKAEINDEFVMMFHKNSKILRPAFLKIFFHYIYLSSSWFATKLVVHTHRKERILSSDYGVSPKSMRYIPVIIPDKNIKHKTVGKYFFYFGYMVRRKGLQFVLDGFRSFVQKNPKSKFKLVLAGGTIPGQEKARNEIVTFIRNNNLERYVEMKGFIEECEQDALYERAYAVVLPAIVSMGSSGPLYHAMSYGKCVIASNIGYLREDITDGKTGILTDNNKWEESLLFAVRNKNKISTIEKNVAHKAVAQSPTEIGKSYMKLYEILI